ncbi:sugar ABC transporter permease [Streptococcus suis]|uniref:Maltose/maltodextrin transport system permease protein n=1 Tax=Streptococcus suis TaxID=1307 RepID=A0A0Z8C795_STRSU|nr:sugar ABC transporter permease [Streptococcus suis]AEB80998.1 putative sugar ABC transporter, permease protein [Streptococcus suis ST3]AGW86903.1 Maltose/maltodextrin ABC transporter, permease protein MalF [Streptococcus suis YB51]NQF65659.1 sugar ABC transporter permease [Streptococcus suis]NQF88629.1 sugar ABC transporter permease [Streptococcus suis]NQG31628.1 sugar ABC transporter permease [Streptococcus suis]
MFKHGKIDLRKASVEAKTSLFCMGFGQFLLGQKFKGILFFGIELFFLSYLFFRGFRDIIGFFTLGTQKTDTWFGIEGDNSIIMLLMGILGFIIFSLAIYLYVINIKDALYVDQLIREGKKIPSFREEIKISIDRNFPAFVLFFPVLGIMVFSVLPIIFMILIAFTNYGGKIVPPELVSWIGLKNFVKIVSLTQFAPTFFKILSWNILWAVLSTGLNYFGGLSLALLFSNKRVKWKVVWRAFPILAYAIPGFISLLAFKFMFSYGGPINQLLQNQGFQAIGFLDVDAKWSARVIGLMVNAWIGVPSIMLLATGLLSNRDASLYEAAEIDGANKWAQFTKITFPYILTATTPVLIGQFVGNFNNFGIFYFLRGGLYLDDYFLASDTDLLINWLYNLSIDNNYYSIGATISLIIFLLTSVLSLSVYVRTSSYKEGGRFL